MAVVSTYGGNGEVIGKRVKLEECWCGALK